MRRTISPAMIGLIAVLIALVAVMTLVVRIATPAGGYVNLSDATITFISLAFGPWVGAIAGGIGTAIADLVGYPAYAPISLVVHGVQGMLIGLIGHRRRNLLVMILAWLVGGSVMVAGYFLGGALLAGFAKSALDIPANLLQAAVGGAIGIPLVFAVRAAYPAIDRLGQRQKWTE